MSQADWLKLVVGALLTTGLTLAGQVFIARYQHRQVLERDRINEQLSRERAQWEELRPRVSALKDTAGFLYTHLGGWAMNHHADEIQVRFRELDTFPAQFAEYPDAQRAIWAFQATAGWILREHGTLLTDEQRQVRQHQLMRDAQLGTPEEQEKRREEIRDEQENVRTIELPERYRALVAAADALLITKHSEATIQGIPWWRRLLPLSRKPTVSDSASDKH